MVDNARLEYAKAYILLQKYDNLYDLDEALYRGTAFADLYRPYKSHSNKKDKKDSEDFDYKDYYKC